MLRIVGVVAVLCGALVLPAWAASNESFDAVEAGREALEKQGHLPWYDPDQDGLQRVDVAPSQDDPKRLSPWATDRRQPAGSSGSLGESVLWPIMRVVAWVGLGALACLVIWGLIWAATRSRAGTDDSKEVDHELTNSASRIEELPVSVAPAHTDLLAAARADLAAGDLGQAIIHAFAHQLVELDKHHLIQLTRGKTNRQYVGELQAHPRFIELLRPTMLAFEDVFFGHHELSRERFQACWNDLDRFHQQLEHVAS